MEIDSKLRCQMSQDLRRLVSGRRTIDEFDRVFEQCATSDDLAVQQVAEFGLGLYLDDDSCLPRLTSKSRVEPATRGTAARCVLFLRSGPPYEWPIFPRASIVETLATAVASLGIPVGIILLVQGLPYLAFGERDVAFWCREIVLGTAILMTSIAHIVRTNHFCRECKRGWQSSGDYDVWRPCCLNPHRKRHSE